MNLLINLVVAFLAFLLARYVLALVGADEVVGFLISLVVGLVVFFQDPAGRLNR